LCCNSDSNFALSEISAGLCSPVALERLLAGGGRVFKAFQELPKQPGLRKFGCASGIVAGLLIFLTMGLACCYAIVDEEIKLIPGVSRGGLIEHQNRFLHPQRLKSGIPSLFAGHGHSTSVIRRSVKRR
jgi:hypothetical protein